MINRNMRCIEILEMKHRRKHQKVINRNMRCIEIKQVQHANEVF